MVKQNIHQLPKVTQRLSDSVTQFISARIFYPLYSRYIIYKYLYIIYNLYTYNL